MYMYVKFFVEKLYWYNTLFTERCASSKISHSSQCSDKLQLDAMFSIQMYCLKSYAHQCVWTTRAEHMNYMREKWDKTMQFTNKTRLVHERKPTLCQKFTSCIWRTSLQIWRLDKREHQLTWIPKVVGTSQGKYTNM